MDWEVVCRLVVCFCVVCLRVVPPVGIRPAEPPCHLALFAARVVVVLLPLLPLCFGSCAAGGGAAFCAAGFCGGSGCRCALGCGAGDRIGTALGGGCIRFSGCRNGLTLRRGAGLFVGSGRAAGKEQRQRQHQQYNAFSCSLQNKSPLPWAGDRKRAQLYQRCLHIFPFKPKSVFAIQRLRRVSRLTIYSLCAFSLAQWPVQSKTRSR